MKIRWLGHSCFLLTSSEGIRVLTDPFDEQVGYELPSVEANIVTTSHDHFDHGYTQIVRGTFFHVNQPGETIKDGVRIFGIMTYHDKTQGSKRGNNIVYTFDINGLKICHFGDIGHVPTTQQFAEIGEIDIALLPVGGTFTVNAAEAHETIKLLKPKITIPMHFKTPELKFDIDGIDSFLLETGLSDTSEVFFRKNEIEITKDNIHEFPKILVLDYK
jgi:L-ascorbate metabolism protein UlaG (beta-lactamase superfamily)